MGNDLQKILERVHDGDQAATTELINRFRGVIRGEARRSQPGNVEDAFDYIAMSLIVRIRSMDIQ